MLNLIIYHTDFSRGHVPSKLVCIKLIQYIGEMTYVVDVPSFRIQLYFVLPFLWAAISLN